LINITTYTTKEQKNGSGWLLVFGVGVLVSADPVVVQCSLQWVFGSEVYVAVCSPAAAFQFRHG
jgi:hypothetical protein